MVLLVLNVFQLHVFSEAHERLMDIYERLDHLDANKAEVQAAEILNGLGFTRTMQHTAVCHTFY